MQNDYKRSRIVDQIRQLESEDQQLIHTINRTKQDEQHEMTRLRQDFAKRLSSMEFRKSSILMEITAKKRELAQLDERMRVEKPLPMSATQSARERRLKPHL